MWKSSRAFSSSELTTIVRTHHSWYGGSPRNPELPVGEAIPLGARILCIADAYDAMTSDRVYRKGRSRHAAFEELDRYSGRQFDPALVKRFIEVVSREHPEHRDAAAPEQSALRFGMQMERLAAALEGRDLPSLSTMAEQLASIATSEGITEIASLAKDLQRLAASDPDLLEVVALTSNLLELCRSAQGAYIESAQQAYSSLGDATPSVQRPGETTSA